MATPVVIPGAGGGSNADPIIPGSDPNLEEPLPLDEGATPGDTDAPEPEGGEDTPEPGTGDEPGGEAKPDGRLIPQWMRGLKESDPKGYAQARDTFFRAREYQSIYPTVQAAREANNLIQSLGGQEGIDKLQEETSFFKEASSQFLKGDPAFTKDLWEEDPIAASLHVQPMLDEYASKDWEGYKVTISRLWDKELTSANFDGALENLKAAIASGNKEAGTSILDSILGWRNSINSLAKKAEDPRIKAMLAERTKGKETEEQAQQQAFLNTYKTEAFNGMYSDAEKVFDSFFKGRKFSDPSDKNDLMQDAIKLADRIVGQDKDFTTQRDKHLAKGNRVAAVQLTKARYARELPEAVKRVARRYGLISGTASKAPQKTVAKPNQQPNGGSPGYAKVNARPDGAEIDRSRTSNEDIMSRKQAILKDGRKVTWAHLVKV